MERRNRFPAWRNRFLGSINVNKYGLCIRGVTSLLSLSNAPSGRILNCRFLISVTSRPKGEYETDGELFWFLSEEELVSSLDKDEFMEVTTLFLSSTSF